MDLTTMDIIYFSFIGLVIVGGIAAILVLCPKENKLRQELDGCYRLYLKGGKLILSSQKPSLFEERFEKPVYIEKGPFDMDIFIDNAVGADGKSYRAGAILQLYLPESGAETAANYLYSILSDFNQDAISENLSEILTKVLAEQMKTYSADKNPERFAEEFRSKAIEKLSVFGYDLYTRPSLKIAENN